MAAMMSPKRKDTLMLNYGSINCESTEKSVYDSVAGFAADLDEIAREGARRMLISVLEVEVEDFLGRKRYERQAGSVGYRNGYGKRRKVAIGSGTMKIRAPRVRESCRPFKSQVLKSYQRQSDNLKAMIPELYLHGLATGDFELALRGFLGDGASLSASSVVRLKEQWEGEYESWRKRSLSEGQYVYLWCDGIYPKAGLVGDNTALLVVLGVNKNGHKEPLAILEGYRESTESWKSVLHDLKERGLNDPRLFVGDGALGLWAAIREVYPKASEQRCWVHKMRNVKTHFPKRLHDEVKGYLREMYYAAAKENTLDLMDQFADRYRKNYPRAVECLLKDKDPLLTYFNYPRPHWVSLKTTNPIESIFASVKLRTNVAKRIRSPRSALFLIFKIIQNAQKRWRRINAPELVEKVIRGAIFENGVEVKLENNKNKKINRKVAA
jgi:transposase-like protein